MADEPNEFERARKRMSDAVTVGGYRFGALAARCARAWGDRVDLWATINEPNVQGLMGYGAGQWPPGHA